MSVDTDIGQLQRILGDLCQGFYGGQPGQKIVSRLPEDTQQMFSESPNHDIEQEDFLPPLDVPATPAVTGPATLPANSVHPPNAIASSSNVTPTTLTAQISHSVPSSRLAGGDQRRIKALANAADKALHQPGLEPAPFSGLFKTVPTFRSTRQEDR